MNDSLALAHTNRAEIIRHRRSIHGFAETGFDLPQTSDYVFETLRTYGYEPVRLIEHGIVCTVGQGRPVMLLRADMDALPMEEESGLPFAAKNGNAHTCGHDMHTAMLLGAAKILKERETELKGTVKLVFQPAEELLIGGKAMVEAGLLENPKPDAALMFHVDTQSPVAVYIKEGTMTTGSNNYRITVSGKGAHGAMPENGVDPVYIGAQIVLGLQELVTREIEFRNGAVVTTGHFRGGSAPNIIPETALLEGTLRSWSPEIQAHLKKRVPEVAQGLARTYRGDAEVEFLSDVAAVVNEPVLTRKVRSYLEAMAGDTFEVREAEAVTASEDFAYISTRVPAVMMMLGAAIPGKEALPLHNPKVLFNEDALPIGTACLVESAMRYLSAGPDEVTAP